MQTYYYGYHSIIIGRRPRYSCSTDILHWPLTWTYDLDFEFRASYSHDPYKPAKIRSPVSWFKDRTKKTDRINDRKIGGWITSNIQTPRSPNIGVRIDLSFISVVYL